ncbi:mobilization protein, partial [Phocaeicola vulgatus]
MKEVRTKKKKHMTKDMNEMKKKRGRPALGRTRKLTRGVTVKFSPV